MMKKIAVIALLLGTMGAANAQVEADLIFNGDDQKKTFFGNQCLTGGFVGLNSKGGAIHSQDAFWMGGEAGVVFEGRHGRGTGFHFGVVGYGLVSSVQTKNLSLDEDVLFYQAGYGGFLFEPTLFSNSSINISFPVVLGAGGILESEAPGLLEDPTPNPDFEAFELQERDIRFRDAFLVAEPGVALNLNLTRWMKLSGGISYRTMYGLSLPNTSKVALDGLNANVSLKLGWF